MSKNNKISKALYDLKKNVVNNKLTNINFDTLDLTEVINEKNNNPQNRLSHLNKANPLETLIKELLKPELKKWLNENLPTIVRQLVEEEIEKIAPKDY